MKKKNFRRIRATVVLEIEFFIDKETEPCDVLNQHNMWIDSDHGMITEMDLIHTAITKDQKVK